MRIEVGTVLRPHEAEHVCGDAFAVLEDSERLLVAVADGLGHGPNAAEASAAFIAFVEANADMPVGELMLAASGAISGTRGAAASLVRIEFAERKLHYCGVGNCHFHSVADIKIHPVSSPGIVGSRVRKVNPYTFDVPAEGLFALCSDGISSRVHLEPLVGLGAQEIATYLMADLGKKHDDVTAVVVRYSAE